MEIPLPDEEMVKLIFLIFKNIYYKQRPVICWNCKEKFLIEPEYDKGLCPVCKKENIIIPSNEISDLWKDFITVVCNECGKRLIVKKESEYVVCTRCKSTIIIEKQVVGNVPPEYSNLTPTEYYLLLSKEKSFNPYLFPKDSPYHLEPHFEKTLKETREGIFDNENDNIVDEYHFKETGDEHLYKTVKQNEKTIKTKYLYKTK